MKKTEYRGFSIEKGGDTLYAVRMHQRFPDGRTIMHDWKPWCESIPEAKKVVDKLIKRWDEMSEDERENYYKLRQHGSIDYDLEITHKDGLGGE